MFGFFDSEGANGSRIVWAHLNVSMFSIDVGAECFYTPGRLKRVFLLARVYVWLVCYCRERRQLFRWNSSKFLDLWNFGRCGLPILIFLLLRVASCNHNGWVIITLTTQTTSIGHRPPIQLRDPLRLILRQHYILVGVTVNPLSFLRSSCFLRLSHFGYFFMDFLFLNLRFRHFLIRRGLH